MILNLLFEIVSPTVALALSNGPIQQEFTGFESANSSEMVDLFTGDFKYNIPLMDVDGYPLNLSYKAGASMETEASWVGLGWSLNPGVLNRMMRGLPDDFNGDQIHSELSMKPYTSTGAGIHTSLWYGTGYGFGIGNLPIASVGVLGGLNQSETLIYDNHKGFGLEVGYDSHFSWNVSTPLMGMSGTAGYGVTLNTQQGGSFTQSYSSGLSAIADLFSYNSGTGTNYNTRNGSILNTYSNSFSANGITVGLGRSVSYPVGHVSYPPKIPFDTKGGGASISAKFGVFARLGIFGCSATFGALAGIKGFYNSMSPVNSIKDLNAYGYLYGQNSNQSSLVDFNRARDQAIQEETPNTSFANSTYDLFFASAQGMSSAFRPFKSDVNIVHDPDHHNSSSSYYAGYEVAPGIFLHALTEASDVNENGSSSTWNAPLLQSLAPSNYNSVVQPTTSSFSVNAIKSFAEQTYFKELGELTARDADYETSIKTDELVSPYLYGGGSVYQALSPIANTSRTKRDKRTKYIKCLTASQAHDYGIEPTVHLYTSNTFSIGAAKMVVPSSTVGIDRRSKISSVTGTTLNLQDHISEVCVTSTNGDQYVYGIPSYNLYKKTVAFNASVRTESNYIGNGTSFLFSDVSSYANNPLAISEPCQYVKYNSPDVTDNRRGLDNFLKTEITPAYASSYLLSSVLSSDYVDITGNGPSYDDFGNFTKFNYSKENDYQWREPYCADAAISSTLAGGISSATAQANFDKGLICDDLDDRAQYEYGVRETYYVHSIETKNFVAVFKTLPRYDGLGVQNEDGAKGTSSEALKLDAIELYSKNELIEKGMGQATPIQSVHFVYSYSLCPLSFNTLTSNNSNNAKLTLSKIYFTYGKSNKSSLSPYEFFYANNDQTGGDENNFSYNPRAVDRWGTYKPNTASAVGATVGLNNVEYPYAEQNKTLADSYAAAWNLTMIKTPAGATIKITYEADDYAYVQNQPAAQMCKIYNCVQSVTSNSVDVITSYSNTGTCYVKYNPQLIIDLSSMSTGISTSLSLSDANAYAKKYLFSGAPDNFPKNFDPQPKPLYFKCFMKVAGPENGAISGNFFEFINGYGNITDVQLFSAAVPNNTYIGINSAGTGTNSCYRFAYVTLADVATDNSGGKSTSPMCLAGWEFLQNYAPRIAYPGSEPANMGSSLSSPLSYLHMLGNGIGVARNDLINAKDGHPNKRFYDQDFCTTLFPLKSFVRVYSANYRKLGGGHRVKSIITEDNWASTTSSINGSGYGENGTSYGQTFEYTTAHDVTGDIISSGIASYEPLTGGDENSMRQEIPFTVQKTFAPNDHFFQEKPLGEMAYPSPVVGYSKVTVRTISDPTVTNVATFGKTEVEFFTAKDFPIVDSTSRLQKAIVDQIPQDATLKQFINRIDNPKYDAVKVLHLAQGNILKFNDMHGKLKSVANYGPDNSSTPVTKTEYFYKTEATSSGQGLASSVPTLDENNVISTKVIARDVDVTADTRENLSQTLSQGTNLLFELGLMVVPLPFYPFIYIGPDIPTINFDNFQGSTLFGYRGATITKVIQQYGILEKVETTHNGNRTVTENLLWDANTGNVVLTKTTNELDQPVYNFNYPAYWAYKEMAPKFKRDGIGMFCASQSSTLSLNKPLDVSTGSFTHTAVDNPIIFQPGDEVTVTDVTNTVNPQIGDRFWIKDDPSGSIYWLVDRQGKLLNLSNYAALNTGSDYVLRLVKPVEKNTLNASIGYVTSLSDPQSSGTINFNQSNQKIVDAGAQEYCSGGSLYIDRSISGQYGTNLPPGAYNTNSVNPVTSESFGNLKPNSSYKYKTARDYATQPNNKTDGLYTTGSGSFTPFWFRESGNPYFVSVSSSNCTSIKPGDSHGNWIPFNKKIIYSPSGDALQITNPIDVPVSTRQGFNHTLPILEVKNANVNEVGFESFEEYANVYPYLTIGTNTAGIYNNDHLGFYSQISATAGAKPVYTTTTSHTGRYSLSFATSQTVDLQFAGENEIYQPLGSILGAPNCLCHQQEISAVKLYVDVSKTYVASMWVKGNSQALDYSGLVSFSAKQTYGTSSVANATITLTNKSPIINGWQKLDYEIKLSSLPGSGTYTLDMIIGSSSGGGFYMDDFRVQPFNSTMICRVYDPLQLRLCAELDDRNFATIYEYDQEGIPVRKNRETLNGLYTVQETRTGNAKR